MNTSMPSPKHSGLKHGGFTLIEVLVALFIVALTLITGVKASNTLMQSAERQKSTLLAQLCIDNYLVSMRLSKQLPGTGEQISTCQQASQNITLKVQINTTPNPSFRRMDIQAFELSTPVLSVSTVLGLL
ncbi:MAG: type II secretion system minor pseudopilin GspI [Betaproteobacteria bacterium]|jgi:general secretion pathway protein I